MEKNYFTELYSVDVHDKIKAKNGLSYVPWAAAWAELKKVYPDAKYNICGQTFEVEETVENKTIKTSYCRKWFDDGKTGWVEVSVTIGEKTHTINLPIADMRNKPIPAENITVADANKAAMRALTKACAMHGMALYVYEGEEFSEETKLVEKLKAEVVDLFIKKAAISEDAKNKANEYCKAADPSGDPRQITDSETLAKLKKELMSIRK